MILHIHELHAVLKDGYFLNLLLRIERCHDLHFLHVVTVRLAKYVDRMTILVADFCGEKQSAFSIRAETYQKPVIQVKEKDSIILH